MQKTGNITNMTNESNGKYEVNIERYVDIKRVSKYTSLSVKTLYEWSAQGKIPSIKMGRRVLFDLYDIDRVMAALKRPCHQQEKTADKIIGDLHAN